MTCIKIGRIRICTDDCDVIRGYDAFRINMRLLGESNISENFKKTRKYRKWMKRYNEEVSAEK